MKRTFLHSENLAEAPELTLAAVKAARRGPEVGCLVDQVHVGQPLIISFGCAAWDQLPAFDFFGLTKELEEQSGIRLNRLLIRDNANAWYHRGVPGLGSHVDEVAASLRSLIASIRPGRVLTIGQGMGGYAAILFGMLLDVDRSIAFGTLSHLDPDLANCYGESRFLAVMKDLQTNRPRSRYDDLLQLGRAIDRHGDLQLIFGTHPGHDDGCSGNLDAMHALRLAWLPNVDLHPYPEAGHAIVNWMADRGEMGSLLRRLVAPCQEHTQTKPTCSMTSLRNGAAHPPKKLPIGGEDCGYRVHRACEGAPLVLVFGRPGAAGEPSEHIELMESIVRSRSDRFSLVFVAVNATTGLPPGAGDPEVSIDRLVAALRSLIDRLKPAATITFGQGLSGHTAILLGVRLRADRIVAIEPVAHRDAAELARYADRRWYSETHALPEPPQPRALDVGELLAKGCDGNVLVLFGSKRVSSHADGVHLNVIHAHWLARSERFRLVPFPTIGDGLLGELSRRGDCGDVLARFLFLDEPAVGSSPSVARIDPHVLRRKRKVYYACHTGFFEHFEPDEEDQPAIGFIAACNDTPAAGRKLDEGWRRWLAENLMLGAAPDGLVRILAERGYTEVESRREIRAIVRSPYYQGARLLRNRLKKQEWLLASYRKLRRQHPGASRIDRRNRLSGADLLSEYCTANRPVIIAGMIDDWPALKKWSVDSFWRDLGQREVEAKVPNLTFEERRGNYWETRKLKLADCMAPLAEANRRDLPFAMIPFDSGNRQSLVGLSADLGDVGEYLHGKTPWAEFWVGPAGATLRMHYYLTNKLIALVTGRLRVRLMPSWDLPLAQDLGVAAAPDDEPADSDEQTTSPRDPQILECALCPTEMLFLPVGWGISVDALGPSAAVSSGNFVFDGSPPGSAASESRAVSRFW